MTHALPRLAASGGARWHHFGRALRWVPLAVKQGIMAVAVLVLAPSAVAIIVSAPQLPAPAVLVAPERLLETAAVRERPRCEGCGYVETMTLINAALGRESYEFGVRMRDGSLRTSTGTNTAKWQVGDRIILIGGVKAATL